MEAERVLSLRPAPTYLQAKSAKREAADDALFRKQIHRADLIAEKLIGAGQAGPS